MVSQPVREQWWHWRRSLKCGKESAGWSRGPRRTASIIRNSCTYVLISLVPLTFGAPAIAEPMIRLVYGTKYLGAVPALSVLAVMGIAWAFNWIPDTLLRVADQQKRLLIWVCISAVVNAAADLFLIPRYGAFGAAWGAGVGCIFGLISIWIQARKFFEFQFPALAAVRVVAASGVSSLLAYWLAHHFAPLPGVIMAIPSAAITYVVLVRMFHVLEESDIERLTPVGQRLPGPLQRAYMALLRFLVVRPALLPEPTS